jgi:hypothetical protein
VSRVLKSTSGRLRLAAAAGAALVLAGCSAGQIAQTAGMEPAVNGGTGQAGDIAVRDVQLVYPDGGSYAVGSAVPLRGVIVNAGLGEDQLVDVTSAWGKVVITGDRNLPAGKTLAIESVVSTPSATTTAPPPSSSTTGSTTSSTTGSSTGSSTASSTTSSTTSSTATSTSAPTTTSTAKPTIGRISLVLTNLAEQVWSGKSVEITFVFRTGGSARVIVPIATPTTPRQPPVEEGP